MGRHSQNARSAGPVDTVIGQRIRARRLEIGMSQEALAAKIGVTFQQVQKYELGRNRIAATMLMDIGDALGLSVAALLPMNPDSAAHASLDPDYVELLVLLTKLGPEERRVLATMARALVKDKRVARVAKRARD